MRSVAALGMSLVAVLSVSAPAFADPPTPPPAAVPDTPPQAAATDTPPQAAATDAPPPAATPAPARKRKPWKEWLDREAPLPVESEATQRIWYGWQTLLVDGLSLTAIAVAAAEEEGAMWFGAGLLLLGSPIVHFAHLNVAHGFYSLAIRAASGGLMALGAAVAVGDDFFVESDGDSETTGTVVAVVGLLGVAAAVVLDASLFGWEERPQARTFELVTPLIDPVRGHFGVGYARSF
jgi:hypothetical protein